MITIMRAGLVVLGILSLSACATPSLFPPEVTEEVDQTFHFEAWRDAPPNNAAGPSSSGSCAPSSGVWRSCKVMFGGRIVQAGPDDNGEGTLIVAEQLPIKRHPVYGPAEEKRTGQYQFAFLYPEKLKQEALRVGNKFIVVGTPKGRQHVMVEGAPKSDPFLVADCVHIWQTGPSQIASFRESVGAGYSSLPEETYCASKKRK